jgi:hypothetical protein
MNKCKYCSLVGLRDLHDNDDKEPPEEKNRKRPREKNGNEKTSEQFDMKKMQIEVLISLFMK